MVTIIILIILSILALAIIVGIFFWLFSRWKTKQTFLKTSGTEDINEHTDKAPENLTHSDTQKLIIGPVVSQQQSLTSTEIISTDNIGTISAPKKLNTFCKIYRINSEVKAQVTPNSATNLHIAICGEFDVDYLENCTEIDFNNQLSKDIKSHNLPSEIESHVISSLNSEASYCIRFDALSGKESSTAHGSFKINQDVSILKSEITSHYFKDGDEKTQYVKITIHINITQYTRKELLSLNGLKSLIL